MGDQVPGEPVPPPALIRNRRHESARTSVTFAHALRLGGCYADAMTWGNDDREMAELRSWLVEQGFVVLSDQYDSDHFGNQIVEMARPVGIRLVRDRGQWRIDLLGPDGNWSPLDRWLDSTAGPRRTSLSVADLSRLLRAHLADIERRASGGDKPSITG